MNTFWAIMADQVIFPVLGIIVTAILGWLAKVLADKAKYTLTTEQQATLHSALMTGLRAAMLKGVEGNDAVSAAIDYALREGAPDAIRKLKVSDRTLLDLALAKQSILADRSPQSSAVPR